MNDTKILKLVPKGMPAKAGDYFTTGGSLYMLEKDLTVEQADHYRDRANYVFWHPTSIQEQSPNSSIKL